MTPGIDKVSSDTAAQWLISRVTGRLHCDSRNVRPGDGFIAWPGAATDARRFVPEVLRAGAAACLVEREGADAALLADNRVAAVAQLKASTGPIAAAFYGHPSQHLPLLAVTGTNGKTSTTWWLAQALSKLKQQTPIDCAVIGTLGVGIPPHLAYTGLTTPDPVTLQHALRDMVTAGTGACAIEASSIGLAERRLDGCHMAVAIFTNFSHDHLDYHGTMAAYWQAKAALFRWPGLKAAVVNVDDMQGVELAATLAQTEWADKVWTYGLDHEKSKIKSPRLRASQVRYADHVRGHGLCFDVSEDGVSHPVNTVLIGHYNVSNLLAVMGTLRALGVALADAAQACGHLGPVPGRMACLDNPGDSPAPLAVIDYAHTPDALDKALIALRALANQRGGKLWCVFGCGGDRDAAKRPVMAAVAECGADRLMMTSDNPRSEKPQAIISQMLLGLRTNDSTASVAHVYVEPDRAKAIAQVLHDAAPADVVLIAGKGHENYQDIAGVKHPFNDSACAQAALATRSLTPS